jgi:hypothetical protein
MTKRLSLARQFLLLQICIVVLVSIAVAGISIAQSATSFRETEGRRLLSVAETVAANDSVRLGFVDENARNALPARRERPRRTSIHCAHRRRRRNFRTAPIDRRLDMGASTVTNGRAWVGENSQLVAYTRT